MGGKWVGFGFEMVSGRDFGDWKGWFWVRGRDFSCKIYPFHQSISGIQGWMGEFGIYDFWSPRKGTEGGERQECCTKSHTRTGLHTGTKDDDKR